MRVNFLKHTSLAHKIMLKNKLTILLPTCNRADTLKWALMTCTTQDYENIQIVVSDNASEDDTAEVVRNARDPRVRYVNTGRRVTMLENFEFALSHVNDGYVTFMGDDDGMAVNGCEELNRILNEYKCDAISGRNAIYNWPGYPTSPGIYSFDRSGEPYFVDSQKAVKDVLNNRRHVYELPVIYNGCAHFDVINRAMRSSGKFFNSVILDFYSGFAIAAVTQKYLSLKNSRPVFVVGASSHSTGMNSTVRASQKEATTAMSALNYASLQGQPELADAMAHVYSYYVADAFSKARDAIPESFLKNEKLDHRRLIKIMMQEGAPYPPSVYQSAVDGVRAIGKKHNLAPFAEEMIQQNPSAHSGFVPDKPPASYLRHYRIYLQTSDFGINNIYDATRLGHHAWVMDSAGFVAKKSRLLAEGGRAARRVFHWIKATKKI